jgi:2-(1,2-epoxy-1,2-dihydrophenyl)acetyl-CoA isomerase
VGFENIDFEVQNGLARLTLNRPEASNAINLGLVRELLAAATICAEDSGIRAVLLTGSGKRFCVGGDLKSFAAAGDGVAALIREIADTLHEALSKLARMKAPLVVAVNGAAAGAGMSMVCMTDIALAADSATFTMAYTAVGLTPDGSSTYFLPKMIGMRRTKELMLTNRRLSAAEALEWGIVQRVVPDDQLVVETEKLARSLASGPTNAFGAVKKLLLASELSDLESQLNAETREIVAVTDTSDAREGFSAFFEKRSPAFKGE